jgi:hypothetical protein
MPESPQASPLAELELGLASSRADRAADAALQAVRRTIDPLDVLRTAALVAASRYDPASGLAPHALATLASVAGLRGSMDPRHYPLAVLQAVVLVAAEKKLPMPQRPPAVLSGEVTHLGRSALLAFRAGSMSEAESIFLGMLDEGWERRMAGEILFRASLEDLGEGGHKLLASVAMWQLARALGFRDARTVLRPAVQYLVTGEPAKRAHATMMAVLGKEWADLDTLLSGGKPLDEPARGRLATALATPVEEACAASILELLHDGYAASSLAEGVGVEASKRLLAAEGYHPELVHALLCARASRFVLEFSRSGERVYALFEAALRVRSPAPHLPSVAVPEALGEDDALKQVVENLATRRPREAAAHVRVFLARGHAAKRLVAAIAYHASLDSSLANQGHNLQLADACTAEYAATKAPEFLMALAKSVASSPKDVTASTAWAAILGL